MASQYNLAEFDPIRRRLQSQFQQQRQTAGDALQRRFASQGMLNSGAYAKTAQQQDVELAGKEAEATQMVDFQEAQEARRRQEIEEARKYQTGEREASQGFARGEREGGQQFQKGMFDQTFGLQKEQFSFEKGQREKEFEQDRYNNWITQLVNMDADFDDPEEMNDLISRLNAMGIRGPGDTNTYRRS